MKLHAAEARVGRIGLAAFCIAFCVGGGAQAQQPGAAGGSYPAKPVRILVGFAPGGGIDAIARIAAQKLGESLAQSFIVDNRAGASGNIAADLVAKAPPDGYTLLMTADVHAIAPSMFEKLPFDPLKDFAPIGTLSSGPQCIATHPSLPVKTLRNLVDLARSKPDSIGYATAGSGTLTHVAMELFGAMAGIRLLHVPYKGSGPSMVALISGEVPVLSIAVGQVLPHARDGRLRILAVTSAERTSLAPELPTVSEAVGLRGYEAVSWQGLLAPAATPPAIINKLNAEIARLLQLADVREQLTARAWVPFTRSPAAFSEMIRTDIQKWSKVVRKSGAVLN